MTNTVANIAAASSQCGGANNPDSNISIGNNNNNIIVQALHDRTKTDKSDREDDTD